MVQGTVQGGTRQYVLVCTGMYLSVLPGTRRYKEVHGGTTNSTRRYKTVCTGMYWYVPICTVQVLLPCGWIRCCNSARLIALY